jgi:MFS transporter, DHA1 family, tetracycline resistance protein
MGSSLDSSPIHAIAGAARFDRIDAVPRSLVVLFLTVFVSLIGFGIIIPLLPFYAQTFGASPTTIGLLFASFSLSQFIAAPVLGDLSDRYGRRPVLIFSLLGTVVSFMLLAVAHSIALLFVARIVDGLSGGNITTARAYIADVTAVEDRAKAYGLIGAAFGLGFIFGPALGAVFAHISYTAPIWAAAVISAAAAGLAFLWLPEPERHVSDSDVPPWWRALGDLMSRRALAAILVVDLFYWFTFSVFQTTFALFGQRRFGWDATHIGYILAGFGAFGVMVQASVVGRVSRALGDRRTLVTGLGLAAFGLAAAAAAPSARLFVAALVPAGLGMGLTSPTLISLISKAVPRTEQGLAQGAAGALESLGRTAGPVFGNSMLQHFGEGSAYGAGALVLLMTVAIAATTAPATSSAASPTSPPAPAGDR